MLRFTWGVRTAIAVALVGVALTSAGPAAAAGPALVAVDSATSDLAAADSGWTVAVELTNLTRDQLEVAGAPTGKAPDGCHLTPDPPKLDPAAHTKVTFAVPAACEVKDGFDVTVTVTDPAGGPAQSAKITAAKPTPAVDWKPLDAFWLALLVLGVLAGAAFALVRLWLGTTDASTPYGEQKWLGRLPFVEASWTFKDSWLTNVTAGAGLLTGIVGTSDVAKALIGSDADDKLRLATVAAAIAAALLAAAPIALGALAGRDGHMTIAGLFVAAALSLSSAIGLLWALGQSAHLLDVPWLSDNGWWLALAAVGLTLWYGVGATISTVYAGLHKEPDVPSEVLMAANAIASAILETPVAVDVDGVVDVAKLRKGVEALEQLQKQLAEQAEADPGDTANSAKPAERVRQLVAPDAAATVSFGARSLPLRPQRRARRSALL